MKYYVAAVRDWPESRMMEAFDHATEIGSEKSFITRKYKTLSGLLRYRLHEHFAYHAHVWAVFRCVDGRPDQFVGLEYNQYDEGLAEIARRYMKVRNRLRTNRIRVSGIPLSVRAS